jgi:FtsH-binding integral membrane protein
MVLAALRRLAIAFVAIFGVTVGVSLLLGWIFGATAQRSVSLGLDLVGAFFLVIGFFVGIRGPVRMTGGDADATGRFVRWAAPDERVETINVSALLVTLGFVLVFIGLALDPRYSLV